MAAFVLVDEAAEHRRAIRRERVFADREDPLHHTDDYLIKHYRLPRGLIIELCELLHEDLAPKTKRSKSIDAMLKVTTALSFYASGSFQHVAGRASGIRQPSVSRLIEAVTEALVRRHRTYVSFPMNNQERNAVKLGFHEVAQMPNVLGAVDGTHVLLIAPSDNEHIYVNRKGAHSINVQGVCDHRMRLTNVVAKYAGSAHDAFIWGQSSLCRQFEMGMNQNGWLLGDSAYPLQPWLMTPFLRPGNPAEVAYNRAHTKTRVLIERSFGLLKSRWRCLDKTGGVLCYSPQKVCRIVVAVAVLHNICVNNNLPAPADNNALDEDGGHGLHDPQGLADPHAAMIRRNLAELILQNVA